ncbi:uncharacterized protein EHS24_008475 [Apiotrichum porosum]|uniref:HIG1 domain-containing protein n=1 Tax=Apiotrichum porosum TaxID=105984 RepID=A0A427XQF3_9TREE|nr:uncharacterized protein EHS24_008475 [Apiotrichum porosum]RSH81041.1 hypothetical protein EHS24_008475 [Apiotrichum porosum]
MTLLSTVAGFSAFGFGVRCFQLGLQKRNIFSRPFGHVASVVGFGSLGYYLYHVEQRQSIASWKQQCGRQAAASPELGPWTVLCEVMTEYLLHHLADPTRHVPAVNVRLGPVLASLLPPTLPPSLFYAASTDTPRRTELIAQKKKQLLAHREAEQSI